MKPQTRFSGSSAAILVAATLLSSMILLPVPSILAGDAPETNSRWWTDISSTVPEEEADRFARIWTARFLDEAGLQAYLAAPGIHDDGFNHLSTDDKAFLVVHLFNHWMDTLPGFRASFSTPDPALNQQRFEELAMLLYATIFAKDEFLGSFREAVADDATPKPAAPVDAGIAEFPGMTQQEIDAYMDALHATMLTVTPAPAVETPDVSGAVVGGDPVTRAFESLPGASFLDLKAAAEEVAPDLPAPELVGETVVLTPPERLRRAAGRVPLTPVGDEGAPDVPALLQEALEGLLLQPGAIPPGSPEELLNLIATGTYLACGHEVGYAPVCAPAPVPLGVPVALDLDADPLTGTGGSEVLVHLRPDILPEYALTGVSALLSVERTETDAVAPLAPLPAHVYVVYSLAEAGMQVVAGFDGSASTLAKSQSARVTLKDIPLALAGDVKLLAELANVQPGPSAALTLGHAKLDATTFPPTPSDPITASIQFEPVPESVVVDLRFADTGIENVIEGRVASSVSPKVTALITMLQGASYRRMEGVIDTLPTDLTFRIESEAVGATHVEYVANAGFTRFAFNDLLVPDTADWSQASVLSAEVLGIPNAIAFDISRPFNVVYQASDRVGSASVFIGKFDAAGLVEGVSGAAQGIPAAWSFGLTEAPLQVRYEASEILNVLEGSFYRRDPALTAGVRVEGIPTELTLLIEDGHVAGSAVDPIALVEGFVSIGGVTAPVLAGNHLSYVANGAGGIGATVRVTGLTSFDVDTRTANVLDAQVMIAGGAPFQLRADDPNIYAFGSISNLPTRIDLTLTPTTLTYDVAQVINTIFLHGEAGNLVGEVTVKGLPSHIDLSWTQTSLTYDANAPITSVDANIATGNLVAVARITSIPTDWTLSWPSGTAAFSTTGAIGKVDLLASIAGGAISRFGGDHASLRKAGSAIGVSLVLSGIKSLSADPRNGGAYSLGLSPGGQAFTMYGDVDGMILNGFISNLPTSVSLNLAPGSNSFSYTASTPIGTVWMLAQRASTGLLAYLELNNLPASLSLAWTMGTAPVITYTASGSLGRIYSFLRQATGGAVYVAEVTSVPAWLRVSVAPNAFTADARTSATAAPGSASIGTISAKYGSDGTLISGPGDHASFTQTATVTRASLQYSGLKLVRASFVNDAIDLEVLNTAPRVFTAFASTPEAVLSVVVNAIPAHVRITSSGTSFTYNAFGSTISSIQASFTDLEGLSVAAQVLGIPGSITVNTDLAARSITYTATSAISALNVDASVSGWDASLRLAGIPAAWSMTFADGAYVFDAPGGAIGSVEATLTNHGVYTTFTGNHLSFVYTQGTGIICCISLGEEPSTAEAFFDEIDASFRMTQVSHAEYKKVPAGNYVDLRMGGNTNFRLYGDLEFSTGDIAFVDASFTPLPGSIQATLGEATSITNNVNFNLLAYLEFGRKAAVAATPNPPTWHGVSVRDGASGSTRGIKARLWLTGLPTGVTVTPSSASFSLTNWRPTQTYLLADLELDNLVSPNVDAYVYLTGLPSVVSMSFSTTTATLAGNVRQVKADLTTTASLGSLYVDIQRGTDVGRLTVSNIPDDIHATINLGNGQTTVTWDASAAITQVYAAYRVSSSGSFQGYVDLDQLPSDFSLTIGRDSGGKGPVLSYTANADTLDLTTFTDAVLFGGDLKARLSFGITNLARSVSVFTSGSDVRFVSSPATGSVYANVWGSYNYFTQDSGTWNSGSWISFPWAYHFGVTPTVNNLAVTLTSFSDFTLRWGLTSKVSGTYGSFSFGWDGFTAALDIFGSLQIRIDWPDPLGSSTLTIVSVHDHRTINVNVLFHKYTNHRGGWFGTSGWAICDWWFDTTIKPHPHGWSWNGATVTGATAEGGAWYLTPDPWDVIPDWAVALGTAGFSPDGGQVGLEFRYDCWPYSGRPSSPDWSNVFSL